jgi:predicted ATPase
MHLHQIEIRNIKALREVSWEIEPARAAGWHVLIGDNGAGKSTFLRAVALALLGPDELKGLRLSAADYVTQGESEAQIKLKVEVAREIDKPTGGGAPSNKPIQPGLTVSASRGFLALSGAKTPKPERHIWGGGGGWFSAGFGAFRRFTGGDKENDRLFVAQPRMAAHLSLFGEDVALTETVRWLKELDYQELKLQAQGQAPGATLLGKLKRFINQPALLPHNTRMLDISTEGVRFEDGRGAKVALESLSDGFRSILSLTMELIRQMERSYGAEGLFAEADEGRLVIDRPGVVLIDEVDAHLHPTWQRRVGLWFRRFFPKVQFLVATHSPFVCQSADEGSVFWLPAPDSQEEARFLTGVALDRILYGNILDAYGTAAFGAVDRSPRAQEMLDALAHLNVKARHAPLTPAEAREQERLAAIFSTQTPKPAAEEQAARMARLKAFVKQKRSADP